MNRPQKKFTATWILVAVAVLLFGIFDDWILRHWSYIWLPTLILVFIAASLQKGTSYSDNGRKRMIKIIERYPGIKIWLLSYTLGCALLLIIVQIYRIDLGRFIGPFELLLLIILLLGPLR